jgi:hypothetical protein
VGQVCSQCSQCTEAGSAALPVGGQCPEGCGNGDVGGSSASSLCTAHSECAAEALTNPEMAGLSAYCGVVTIASMMGGGGGTDGGGGESSRITACWSVLLFLSRNLFESRWCW